MEILQGFNSITSLVLDLYSVKRKNQMEFKEKQAGLQSNFAHCHNVENRRRCQVHRTIFSPISMNPFTANLAVNLNASNGFTYFQTANAASCCVSLNIIYYNFYPNLEFGDSTLQRYDVRYAADVVMDSLRNITLVLSS